MNEIVWQDPPPAPGKKFGRAKQFVEYLKQRPGEWALYPKSMARDTTWSAYRALYAGTEWVCRPRDDGRFDMYGRWIGTEEAGHE